MRRVPGEGVARTPTEAERYVAREREQSPQLPPAGRGPDAGHQLREPVAHVRQVVPPPVLDLAAALVRRRRGLDRHEVEAGDQLGSRAAGRDPPVDRTRHARQVRGLALCQVDAAAPEVEQEQSLPGGDEDLGEAGARLDSGVNHEVDGRVEARDPQPRAEPGEGGLEGVAESPGCDQVGVQAGGVVGHLLPARSRTVRSLRHHRTVAGSPVRRPAGGRAVSTAPAPRRPAMPPRPSPRGTASPAQRGRSSRTSVAAAPSTASSDRPAGPATGTLGPPPHPSCLGA